MKRLAITLLAASGLSVGLIQLSSAADLPMKAPPMVAAPVPFSWTGFYVGGNVGYSWGKADSVATLGGVQIFSDSLNVNGVIGGGQLGYNWQTGNFVLGIEADIWDMPSTIGCYTRRVDGPMVTKHSMAQPLSL